MESATGLKVSSFMGLDARAVSSLPFLISAIAFEALYQQNSGETASSDDGGAGTGLLTKTFYLQQQRKTSPKSLNQ